MRDYLQIDTSYTLSRGCLIPHSASLSSKRTGVILSKPLNMANPSFPVDPVPEHDLMNDPMLDASWKRKQKSVEDADTCRICRGEGSKDEPLFYPCKCSGSIKFVHQNCLMEWLSHSQKKHCELCKTSFRFTKLYRPHMPNSVPQPNAGFLSLPPLFPNDDPLFKHRNGNFQFSSQCCHGHSPRVAVYARALPLRVDAPGAARLLDAKKKQKTGGVLGELVHLDQKRYEELPGVPDRTNMTKKDLTWAMDWKLCDR